MGCSFLLLIYAVAYFSSFLDVFDGILMRICALEILIITIIKKYVYEMH